MFGLKKKGKEEKQLRGSSFDLICTILPVGAIGVVILILNVILISLSPLFGCDVAEAFRIWGVTFGFSTLFGYVGLLISAIICYIKERHRIKNVPLHIKIFSSLLWPFFAILLVPLQIVAMFTRKFTWTPIEHSYTANHSSFNAEETKEIKEKK